MTSLYLYSSPILTRTLRLHSCSSSSDLTSPSSPAISLHEHYQAQKQITFSDHSDCTLALHKGGATQLKDVIESKARRCTCNPNNNVDIMYHQSHSQLVARFNLNLGEFVHSWPLFCLGSGAQGNTYERVLAHEKSSRHMQKHIQ